MTSLRWFVAVACAVCFSDVGGVTAQVAPKAGDFVGTWERVSTKDVKTGAAVPGTGMEWIQFTRSHWMLLNMGPGRKVITNADFEKLSPDAKVKTNYARIWNEKNDQIFAARGGTYRLAGDKLHHPATMAIYAHIIGVDRVLKIMRIDKATLVAQTEYPDDPTLNNEVTYRRVDYGALRAAMHCMRAAGFEERDSERSGR